MNIYNRGALGEAMAFIFLPLIIFFIIKTAESKNFKAGLKWIAGGGLAVAGLILTHNIVCYMFIPMAFLLAVVVLEKIKELILIFWIDGRFICCRHWLTAN